MKASLPTSKLRQMIAQPISTVLPSPLDIWMIQVSGRAVTIEPPTSCANVQAFVEVGINLAMLLGGKIHAIDTMIVDELQYDEAHPFQVATESQQQETMLQKENQNVEEAHRSTKDRRSALEAMIDCLCGDLPEVTVPTLVAPTTKLESLVPVLKALHIVIQIVRVEFEQQIAETKMKLQPETPREVECSTRSK